MLLYQFTPIQSSIQRQCGKKKKCVPILQSTEMLEMLDPPSISVQLAIDPPQFIPGCQPTPTLSVTANSHATEPITIFSHQSKRLNLNSDEDQDSPERNVLILIK